MRFSATLQWLSEYWRSSGSSTAGGRTINKERSAYDTRSAERVMSCRGLKAGLGLSLVLTLIGGEGSELNGDSLTPLQWDAIIGAGGKGGPTCSPTPNNPSFPNGCDAFNILGTSTISSPQVAANGGGDLLLFPYWTVESRDTLLAITNTFGGQAQRFVHIIVYEGVDSQERLDFTICLSPGDVWTAAITRDGPTSADSSLIIGNPGSCDEAVANSSLTPPPLPNSPEPVPNAVFGYIEAYTMECTTRPVGDDSRPQLCSIPNGNNDGGDDVLIGTATLVNAQAGVASSYNATAWVGFNAYDESASTTNSDGTGTVPVSSTYVPLLPGVGSSTAVSQSLANEGGVSKELLLGRWTASSTLTSTTQVVLTFPGNAQPGVDDPVSIRIFDEDENFAFSPREITLDRVVNVCTFMNGANTTTSSTQLSCNGGSVFEVLGPGGAFTGGWFRIMNNNDRTSLFAGNVVDPIGDGTGQEFDNINAPPDASFAVLGFVSSSIFDDSLTPLQWYAIIGVGGIGGTACSSLSNPTFPVGCNAFDIP